MPLHTQKQKKQHEIQRTNANCSNKFYLPFIQRKKGYPAVNEQLKLNLGMESPAIGNLFNKKKRKNNVTKRKSRVQFVLQKEKQKEINT